MKKTLVVLFLLLTATMGLHASTVGDTANIHTPIRIILPEDTKGWVYYFYMDGQGHPPVQLDGRETTMTVSTNKRSFSHAYIYASNMDINRQTNKFAVKLTGRPVFLMVKSTDGVIVRAKKLTMNKYAQQRMHLPEGKRAPWIN